jgi:hypothetical protein
MQLGAPRLTMLPPTTAANAPRYADSLPRCNASQKPHASARDNPWPRFSTLFNSRLGSRSIYPGSACSVGRLKPLAEPLTLRGVGLLEYRIAVGDDEGARGRRSPVLLGLSG